MWIRHYGWVAVIAGCGRFHFSPIGDAATVDDARQVDARSDALQMDARNDAPANAITVTFGERSGVDFNGVTADTFISNEAGEPTFNNGAADVLRSESDVDERILLRFDLTAIPTTATVFEVTLTLEITSANAAATLVVHPLLEAWTEGTLDGAAGIANYSQRTIGAAWSTTGAGPGGSAGSSMAALQPAALGALDVALAHAAVQSWITAPATNFGMIFINTHTDTARFASRENAVDSRRPLLTVTYLP